MISESGVSATLCPRNGDGGGDGGGGDVGGGNGGGEVGGGALQTHEARVRTVYG